MVYIGDVAIDCLMLIFITHLLIDDMKCQLHKTNKDKIMFAIIDETQNPNFTRKQKGKNIKGVEG